MAQIEVTINGRGYPVVCDDGQEDHIAQLAEYVSRKVEELVAAMGQVGDARLLVMASLLMADELAEAYATIDETEQVSATAARAATAGVENRAAAAIAALAERIEGIAARLEPT